MGQNLSFENELKHTFCLMCGENAHDRRSPRCVDGETHYWRHEPPEDTS